MWVFPNFTGNEVSTTNLDQNLMLEPGPVTYVYIFIILTLIFFHTHSLQVEV